MQPVDTGSNRRRPHPLRSRSSIRRIREAGSIALGPNGVRFGLVDHLHRQHTAVETPSKMVLALILLGCGATGVAFAVDFAQRQLYMLRVSACSSAAEGGARWAVWMASAAMPALAASWLVRILPMSAGSGLPEVKSALSGVLVFDAFSPKMLLVKPVALALALASGLSIGKEGPFVHMACCIGATLASSRLFARAHGQLLAQRREALLTAACALGVVCTFGAPVGGVLFAVEVTAAHYEVAHLSYAFVCVVTGLLFMTHVLRPVLLDSSRADPLALFVTSFAPEAVTPLASLAYATQGALLGAVASAAVRVIHLAAATLRPLLDAHKLASLFAPPLVAAAIAAFNLRLSAGACESPFLEGGGGTLNYTFSAKTAAATGGHDAPTLLLFALTKLFALTPLSLALPVPTGVFLPTFVSGAALGHASGFALLTAFPASFAGLVPGQFAVAGAVAVTGAATLTISTAVLTLELSGQLSLHLPLLLSVISSYLVAKALRTPSREPACPTHSPASGRPLPLPPLLPLTRSLSSRHPA